MVAGRVDCEHVAVVRDESHMAATAHLQEEPPVVATQLRLRGNLAELLLSHACRFGVRELYRYGSLANTAPLAKRAAPRRRADAGWTNSPSPANGRLLLCR